MSNIVEAPSPKELLTELRKEAKSLPKDPRDPMLSGTRRNLAEWMYSLHSKKRLGGEWESSREVYYRVNNSMRSIYVFSRIDTLAIVVSGEH